ncbi:DUF6351 family protein [Acinetobacter shaoyimingii]|uniref:DUF6351 domain-containing protein n=1 Tax=Acinetobacter shaoyimingii TaxID=2715164 RepID=A0A6G8RUL5_9GAMM|nr:DUF6351 family protein [Acinetobacter shaoyimingii]QIO05581.1 hypothetical protein G8E00_06245 [Acinetobacter shaoyimingii]
MKIKFLYTLLSIGIGSSLITACGSSDESNDHAVSANPSSATAKNMLSKTEKEMIAVLSTRPDLITDGDVLLQLDLPADTNANEVKITLNGKDITSAFQNQAQTALISNLVIADNQLITETSQYIQHLTLKNHDTRGPLISGPQLNPWTCKYPSEDAFCSQPVKYNYYYRNRLGQIKTYDPNAPPSSNAIATTTTDQGISLPFIVREEVGYQNRDEYRIAVLFDPQKTWSTLSPQPQFNHKLIIAHGHGCDNDYRSGTAPDVIQIDRDNLTPDLTVDALGQGYAVLSASLAHSNHNCNIAVQAESLLMAKERFIEQYGTLRYTIGQGCSGGSLVSQSVANAYPGIYQGLLVTCSFPDTWSTATQFVDYHLMIHYFKNWKTRLRFLPSQIAHVQGHISEINGLVSERAQFDVVRPNRSCKGLTEEQLYHPDTNPTGSRCTIHDAAINLFGPRPPEIWTENEKKIGHGFAGLAMDNVGVQYGLDSLLKNKISEEQFVVLNEKIGGIDIDINATPERVEANYTALNNAYRTGSINVANNLNKVAIIDCRGPDPAAFHDSYRAFAVRARLDKAHGHHNNHLIYGGSTPLIGDFKCLDISLKDMDQWLSQVEKDNSALPIDQKLTANKPSQLGDSCIIAGIISRKKLCNESILPVYRTPRMVAGDSISTYHVKCQLKPLLQSDYGSKVRFSNDQWNRLQAVFPKGVCDFNQEPVGFANTIPWMTYQDANQQVIYGGTPMSPVSKKSARGWAAPAFELF